MKSFPIHSLFVFTSLLFLTSCQKEEPVRPNILILFTDDHRYNTLNFLGNEHIRTPNLDRLAAEGVAFRRAHVMGGKSGAICVPSRAMLLTGRYVHSLEGAGDVIPPDHITMPETFGGAGYTTFFTGKWHNDKPSFVRSFASGGNIFFGGMHFENVGGHFAPWLHQFDSSGRYPDEAKQQAGKFSSEAYADAAVDFLQRQKDSDRPFYCNVAFTSPHDPRTPPPGFESTYDPENIPLPANYLPEHPFDNGELKVRDEQLLPWPRTEEAVRKELALYYAMISEVDAQIGRILEALEKSGKKDNTIIVFAGDNGLAVGSHGLLGKQNLYEHSIRIPMIIAGPGIPKNAVRESFVYLSDIFPTLAALIGVNAPPTAEGKDIRPVILRDEAVRDNAFYIYRDLQRGVRTSDNWKLIKYMVKGEVITQLFNLNDDPDEVRNLAGDPAHAGKLAEMETLLKAEMKAYGDDLDPDKPYFGKLLPKDRSIKEQHLAMSGEVTYLNSFSPKYPASGARSLIDGRVGLAEDFSANWQGFEGDDFEVVIDLRKTQPIRSISAGFLEAQGSWIFLPEIVEFAISEDGKQFNTVGRFESPVQPQKGTAYIRDFSQDFEKQPARFVKVIAGNTGVCPDWHPGAGGKAWLFSDEIVVR